MRVVVSNEITIFEPTDELCQWCKKNLVVKNPDWEKKFRMKLWLGDTPEKLWLYKVDAGALILPFGVFKTIFPMIEGAEITTAFPEIRPVNYRSTISLFDYQEPAVDAMFNAGWGILESKAGSGKTQMGLALVAKLGCKTLWLTHTSDLLEQSRKRAAEYMDSSLFGEITAGKVNIGKGITFATVQTLVKQDLTQFRDTWDCVIVDECFPENTMVMTPHGNVPIQYIVPGELVVTRNELTGRLELCQVDELQIRSVKGRLVEVKLANGQKIVCTENHPFYTQHGYKSAGDLTNDDEVRVLRKGFRYFDMESKPTSKIAFGKIKAPLLTRVCHESDRSEKCMDGRAAREIPTTDEGFEFRNSIRPNEEKQPHVKPSCAREDVEHAESDRTQASVPRWEWERVDQTTENLGTGVERFFARNGICHSDQDARPRLSNLLQGRHRPNRRKTGDRGRRWLSLLSKSADRRYEESGVLKSVGVESVTVLQCGSDGKFGALCRDNRVYNLSVKGNHNYFADGILVHNCHRVAGSPTKFNQFGKVLSALACKHKYGLSATVHRADGLTKCVFTHLGEIAYSVPDEAIADKVMTVKIQRQNTGTQIHPSCLDTDGTLVHAKLINYLAGNSRRNFCIANDLVENADHYNLILSDRLEHLRWLMACMPDELQDLCVMIDGSMTTKKGKAEREQAIEDMRSGKKRYLFASYSLAREGLDIPRLDRLYMATPVKDYAVVVQSVGRIARTFEGKSEPICYDYVDDISYLQKMFSHRLRHYRKGGCRV